MLSYEEFVNQFPAIYNPNITTYRKSLQPGYCYHHIIPVSYQASQLGIFELSEINKFKWSDQCDKSCVLLSYRNHAFAHWLWDREHPECHTVRYFRNITAQAHNIHLSEKAFLAMDASYVYELFEILDHTVYTDLSKKTGRLTKAMWQDPNKREYIRKRMSEAKIGKPNVCVGRKWMFCYINSDKKIFKRVPAEKVNSYKELGWIVGAPGRH